MNKTHSHSWTLYPWSGGAWRNQVILHSHQSAVCRYLHEEPWKTEIPGGKICSPTLKIQNIVRWTLRRSARNPGISYSDLLILIPGSRVIFTWSLFMLFILQRSRPLSMMSLWHHGSKLLSLIYGIILTPYDTIIRIHHIGQWPLSLLSIIRAVYLFISYCTHMYKQYWAVYKTGLTASLNNELSCSCSLIITALRSLPLYLTATLLS